MNTLKWIWLGTFFGGLCILTYTSDAHACASKCDLAFAACSVAEAKGCEKGGQAAGQAVEALANQAPIPGMGKFLGKKAQEKAEALCKEKLAPCKRILATCYEGCGLTPPTDTDMDGMAPGAPGEHGIPGVPGAAAPPPKPIEKATFRIFSDQPRTLVFINGERMGATPEDTLAPFITPDLLVGKYWVRLVSLDNKWAWEGPKDVQAGNVNAVEGKLEYVPQKELDGAMILERGDHLFEARDIYAAFLTRWPTEEKLIQFAQQRYEYLTGRIQQIEDEFFNAIIAEQDMERRLYLCNIYLRQYPQGFRRSTVQEIAVQTSREVDSLHQERDVFSVAMAESDTDRKRTMLSAYLTNYPAGTFAVNAYEEIQRIDKKVETDIFRYAGFATTDQDQRELYADYLQRYPQGHYVAEAEKKLAEIDRRLEKTLLNSITVKSQNARRERQIRGALQMCDTFITDYPDGEHADTVKGISQELQQQLEEVLEDKRRKAVGKPHRVIGISLWSTGGVLGVTGLILGGRANADRKHLEKGCRDALGNEAICEESYVSSMQDGIRSKALAADILIWTGVATIAGGVVLYVLSPSWKKRESLSWRRPVRIGAAPLGDGRGASISLQGEF